MWVITEEVKYYFRKYIVLYNIKNIYNKYDASDLKWRKC
jgi:hypothetical protein